MFWVDSAVITFGNVQHILYTKTLAPGSHTLPNSSSAESTTNTGEGLGTAGSNARADDANVLDRDVCKISSKSVKES